MIELMIVVAIIGIVASIAVPAYIARRVSANESAVVATMRAISQAQMQFKSQNSVDVDQDGTPEFASLGELTGLENLRGTTVPLDARLLSVSLGNPDAQGRVLKHGYHFALYLPDAAGNGVAATAGNRGSFDAGGCASYWTCLAWPDTRGLSGNHTFFVNQQGRITKTDDVIYSGSNAPTPGAGLVGSTPNRIDSAVVALSATGADGLKWLPVN